MEHRIPAKDHGIQGIPSPPVEDSFNFQTSFRELGQKLKAHNDTLGELQGLGVSHDVPLPELVLVGDQSAGKSTIMSGLASLDLPRSDGTCTRCPLHIRVSRNSSWSCRISLQKMYRYAPPADGTPINEKDVTDRDPFYPWRQLESSTTTEFKAVQDNAEIEETLRWAQIAILNPDKPSEMFVPGSGSLCRDVDQAETTAKFSPNVVFLEIKGPEFPNLSFYDLPGIFQNSKNDEDSYTIHVVKNLAKKYIQRESAIIMCTMPMNNDPENSATAALVRHLRASHRTVGVLTKADLVPPSSDGYARWLDIMAGKSHRTGPGYFITSRPQGRTLEELTQWEDMIFRAKSVESWPVAFHKYEHRCGIAPLNELVSQKLAEQFANSLPHIERKVKVHLNRINKELATLPDLPTNTEHEVKKSLREFSEAARQNIEVFRKTFNTLPSNFSACVLGIHPKFMLRDASDTPVVSLLDSDDEDDTQVNTPTNPAKRRHMAPPETPSKRHRSSTPASQHSIVMKSEEPDNGITPRQTPQPPTNRPGFAKPFDKYDNVGRGFRNLRQVRDEIEAKARAGMPGRIPPEVYDSLALEALKPIELPMRTFLFETSKLLRKELSDALRTSLNGLHNRVIFQECGKHLKTFLDKHTEIARDHMLRCYSVEMTQITTFDHDSLKRFEEEDHLTLVRWRHKQRMIAYGDPKAQAEKDKPLRDWKTMSEAERDTDVKKRTAEVAKIGADIFSKELEVISYVRGYYRLAAQRFVDNVIQVIFCLMIPAMKAELSLFLDQQLGLIGNVPEQTYERLMEENPEMSARRESLRREKTKFEKALASIDALKRGDGEDDTQDAEMVDVAAGEV